MEILILLLTICKSNKAYRRSHIQFVIFNKIPNSRDPAGLVQCVTIPIKFLANYNTIVFGPSNSGKT